MLTLYDITGCESALLCLSVDNAMTDRGLHSSQNDNVNSAVAVAGEDWATKWCVGGIISYIPTRLTQAPW